MNHIIILKRDIQTNPYHLLDPSSWPVWTSITLGSTLTSYVLVNAHFEYSSIIFWISLISTILNLTFWFHNVSQESDILGEHTIKVTHGILVGIILFIISEIMFFFFVFWSYFHTALSPNIELGCSWPPLGIDPLNPKAIPTLNTVLLLASGCSVTWSHHSILLGNRKSSIIGLILTIILALIFINFQVVEYFTSTFTMADSYYGNIFFLGTGAHGFHVILGATMLSVALIRIMNYSVTGNKHIGYESSILYWHLVDGVWLILYVIFYWWGS